MRLFTRTCLLVAALWWGGMSAHADYPDKPIRMIVPQAPGSATDTAARILASELSLQLNQTIVVENRPGGGQSRTRWLHHRYGPRGFFGHQPEHDGQTALRH